MASSNVDQNRNATPSWSGYIHQGKVGFLVSLRQLKKCIDDKAPDYENYVIRYENAEDFDIVDNNDKVISRHQVKAYIDGTSREQYLRYKQENIVRLRIREVIKRFGKK